MYYWGDPTVIFLIPAMILVFWAQAKVRSAYNQWSQVRTRSGVTAADVARDILAKHNLSDIPVEYVPGHLTDHYDPQNRVIRLSASTYNSTSIAAIGVAAHEVGHAIQHDVSYAPLQVRNMIYPVAHLGDSFGPILVVLGLFWGGFAGNKFGTTMMDVGILAFCVSVAFYMITLPVEFNASRRALAILDTGGYMTRDEVAGAREMLTAAALTYVGAAATSIGTLARLLFLRFMAEDDERR